MVEHVLRLAHLDLDEASLERFRHELETILDYVASLSLLDVGEVPPTAHPLSAGQPLRRDEVRPSLDRERALANAPDAAAGHFRVPRVLEP